MLLNKQLEHEGTKNTYNITDISYTHEHLFLSIEETVGVLTTILSMRTFV